MNFRNRMTEYFEEQGQIRNEELRSLVERISVIRQGISEETQKVREVVAKIKNTENPHHQAVVRALSDPFRSAVDLNVIWRSLTRDQPSDLDLIVVIFGIQNLVLPKDHILNQIRAQAADLLSSRMTKAGYYFEEGRK